jgi:trehalose-6-phosphate synthase
MTITTSRRSKESQWVPAIERQSLSQSVHSRTKYHLRAGSDYLHWSASKLTTVRSHAWVGTIEQARACRRTFDAAAGCKAVAQDEFLDERAQ